MIKNKVSTAQLKYIKTLQETLTEFNVKFTGTTKKEASKFIEKYAPYAKDINRLDRGYPPYHTNYPVIMSDGIPYKPSHFVVVPHIKNYIHQRYSEMMPERFGYGADHSWGDDWGEFSW